jgi:hypothetical protein
MFNNQLVMQETQVHSERYNSLSSEEQAKVETILSSFEGKTIAEIKKLLGTVNRELDIRGSLSHQLTP